VFFFTLVAQVGAMEKSRGGYIRGEKCPDPSWSIVHHACEKAQR